MKKNGHLTASNGYTFSRLEMGKVGFKKMFEDARSENNIMAWVLRVIAAAFALIYLLKIKGKRNNPA